MIINNPNYYCKLIPCQFIIETIGNKCKYLAIIDALMTINVY